MCPNPESIFTEKYLPKSKPIKVDILYRLPDKIDFGNCIDQTFSQCNRLETQECYIFADFNINLIFKGEEIFKTKIVKTPYKEMLPLTK